MIQKCSDGCSLFSSNTRLLVHNVWACYSAHGLQMLLSFYANASKALVSGMLLGGLHVVSAKQGLCPSCCLQGFTNQMLDRSCRFRMTWHTFSLLGKRSPQSTRSTNQKGRGLESLTIVHDYDSTHSVPPSATQGQSLKPTGAGEWHVQQEIHKNQSLNGSSRNLHPPPIQIPIDNCQLGRFRLS